jgi:non-specific protein-tyrosine kinase
MKIRKAMEKAKKDLAKQPASDIVAKHPDLYQEWTSPVYSETRQVVLNKDVLAKNRCIAMSPGSPFLGPYKVLRTQIYKRTQAEGWNTLMVTSAVPGEGKSLTAINLALTFAKEFDQTVLLMDCDLHRQDIHKLMGIDSDLGLADYLVDERPLKDLLIWPGIEKLTLISGNRTIADSTEFLTSSRMTSLVQEIKNRYADRFVVFDTPPVLSGADAIAFVAQVDCFLMVVEADKTPLPDIKRALELLPKEKFLGFVLNRYASKDDDHYAYY